MRACACVCAVRARFSGGTYSPLALPAVLMLLLQSLLCPRSALKHTVWRVSPHRATVTGTLPVSKHSARCHGRSTAISSTHKHPYTLCYRLQQTARHLMHLVYGWLCVCVCVCMRARVFSLCVCVPARARSCVSACACYIICVCEVVCVQCLCEVVCVHSKLHWPTVC